MSEDEILEAISSTAVEVMTQIAEEKGIDYSEYWKTESRELFNSQYQIMKKLLGEEALRLMIQKMFHNQKEKAHAEE